MSVAVAEPAMPIAGMPNQPRMKTGLSPLSSTTLSTVNHNGVIESPTPRSAMPSSTSSIVAGRPRKMTRR